MADNESNPRRHKLVPVDANLKEGFFDRWSRRKTHERSGLVNEDRIDGSLKITPSNPLSEQPERLATDADMPPLESLNERSDYSGFMSPQVSDELRRLALRKLFHLPKFNIRDGLDDYDEDFRSFEGLKDIITADMRHQMEQRFAEEKGQTEEMVATDGLTPKTEITDKEQVAADNHRTKGELDDSKSTVSEEYEPPSSSS